MLDGPPQPRLAFATPSMASTSDNGSAMESPKKRSLFGGVVRAAVQAEKEGELIKKKKEEAEQLLFDGKTHRQIYMIYILMCLQITKKCISLI